MPELPGGACKVTADSESLLRGAARVREIHLFRKIEKMYKHALQSSWPLPFVRGSYILCGSGCLSAGF